jgi:hypothetical protein
MQSTQDAFIYQWRKCGPTLPTKASQEKCMPCANSRGKLFFDATYWNQRLCRSGGGCRRSVADCCSFAQMEQFRCSMRENRGAHDSPYRVRGRVRGACHELFAGITDATLPARGVSELQHRRAPSCRNDLQRFRPMKHFGVLPDSHDRSLLPLVLPVGPDAAKSLMAQRLKANAKDSAPDWRTGCFTLKTSSHHPDPNLPDPGTLGTRIAAGFR